LNVLFAVKIGNVIFVVRFNGTAVKRMKLRKINSVQKMTTGSRRIAV